MVQHSLPLTVPVNDAWPCLSEGQRGLVRAFLEREKLTYVTVKFSRPHKERSLKQNAYLWGVVYQYMAHETGHSPEEIHLAMKEKFITRKFLPFGSQEIEIRRTTTDMTPSEFSAFVEQVTAFAGRELGIRIPLPGES